MHECLMPPLTKNLRNEFRLVRSKTFLTHLHVSPFHLASRFHVLSSFVRYSFHLFFAERHTTGSNFEVTSTFDVVVPTAPSLGGYSSSPAT